MTPKRLSQVAIGFAIGTCLASAQQTINVPADQPTIQAGINAALNGDTVLVAPGTYIENINFMGKAITVTSSGGPANTTINGSQGDSVISFVSGETLSSVINGFTIENAGASMYPNTNPDAFFMGINIGESNPTVTNNVITKNYGYGIYVYAGGGLISGNTISYTSTQYNPLGDFGCDYDDGDGIFVIQVPFDPSVTTTISNNTIEYNVGHCDGGGIGIYATSATITNNIIRYNQSLGQGGGIWDTSGSPIIQNLIYGNIAGVSGGGIYLGNAADLFIVQNTIVGNTISANGLIEDAYEDGSQITFGASVTGTAFFNNIIVAGDTYSAIACNPTYQYLSPTPLLVDHSDILNFSGATFGGWCTVPPTITNAMISANPKFLASGQEPFRLVTGSPATGSGNISAVDLPSQDIDGNPRIQIGTVDMGVYEGASAATNNPAPNFTIVAVPTSLTIQTGQSATSTLTVTPVGGYIGAISLSCTNCSGLPLNMHYQFNPQVLAVGGDNTVLKSTLTVSASSTAATAAPIRPQDRGLANFGVRILSCCLVSVVLASTRRHLPKGRSRSSFSVLVLLLLSAGITFLRRGLAVQHVRTTTAAPTSYHVHDRSHGDGQHLKHGSNSQCCCYCYPVTLSPARFWLDARRVGQINERVQRGCLSESRPNQSGGGGWATLTGKYNGGLFFNIDRNNWGCATSPAFREVALTNGGQTGRSPTVSPKFSKPD